MLSLSVTADGPGKDMFTYQWKKSGSTSLPSTVSGGNSAMLTISSVKSSDSGSYHCIVMNRWGNMTKSKAAKVNVLRKSITFVYQTLVTKLRRKNRHQHVKKHESSFIIYNRYPLLVVQEFMLVVLLSTNNSLLSMVSVILFTYFVVESKCFKA